MGERKIGYSSSLDASGFLRGQGVITAALGQMQERVAGVNNAVRAQVMGMSTPFTAVGASVAALASTLGLISFAGMVRSSIEGAAKLHDLRMVTGMTVEAMSAMSSVGKLSGTTIDDIAAASNKLSKAMAGSNEESKGAAQAVQALGLNYQEFMGMSPEARMQAVAVAMAQWGDSGEKTAAAMALFGKEGAKLLPFLDDLAKVGALQAKVTAEQAAQADNFSDNLAKLQASGEGWKKELSFGLLPALNEGSEAVLKLFNGTGGLRDQIRKLSADGTLAEWTRSAIRGLSYVLDVAQLLGRAFKAVGETIGAMLAVITSQVGGVFTAVNQALRGDFAGAGRSLAQGFQEGAAVARQWRDTVADIFAEETLGQRFRKAMEEARSTAAEPAKERPRLNYKATPEKEKDARDKADHERSYMPVYEAALAEEKRFAAEKDALREYTKAQELAYWKDILATYEVGSKDRISIARKVSELELEVLRENARQKKALDEERLRSWHDNSLGALEEARAEARGRLELGEITRAQLLDIEARLEAGRNQIRLQYLRERLAALDPERDPIQYEQVSRQIEQAEREHRQRMRQIQVEQQGEQRNNPIVRTFEEGAAAAGRAVGAILTGQQTLGKGIAGIWQSVRQSIAGEIARIVQARIVAFARERVLSLAGIGTKAAEAGAGAAASQAAIPIIGPGLALAAMATVMGAVLALGGKVPSAARGWDIPAGMNPLTQLHEREMVLPQAQADVIRGLAEGGSGPAAQAPVPVSLRTVPMGEFLAVHSGDFAKFLRQLERSNAWRPGR